MNLIDDLISNPDISRVLCIAIAAEAQKSGEEVDSLELSQKFQRIVRSLNRTAFADEARKLARLGAERYLKQASRLLGE